MPPLPTALDAQTLSTIDAVGRRLRDLAEVQVPRLRACTGPLARQQQFAGELRDDTDTCAQHIEALEVAVDDQQGESSRRELRKVVDQFQEELAKIRKDARAALLASKRVIDAQSVSNRAELLRASAFNEKQTGTSSADDALMQANNDVTTALQRVTGRMQEELEKSVLSVQMLDDSTATLQAASGQHDTLALVMGTSKQLIAALERSDWLDRMLLGAGLCFFGLVVLFVLKQRILDRGIRIAFWWTRFLPDSRGAEVLDMAERGAVSASVAQTLASISTGAAAAAATAVSVLTASVSSLAPEHTEAAFTSTMPVMDVDVDADMDVHTDDVTTADDEDGDSLDAFLPHGTVAGDVHDEL